MAESVVAQVKEVPSVLVGTVKRTPVLAIGIMIAVLLLVLLVEAYKPGLLTGPLKNFLHMVGVKNA